MTQVPVGGQDFKVIRESDVGYYYVDKTPLIQNIMDRPGESSLFTRPRRFGKSLNLSMLDAYLNFRYAGNRWFDGLAISEIRKDDPLKNSFPVLHLNFQNLDVESFENFVSSFRVLAQNLYGQFPELEHSDKLNFGERKLFESIVSMGSDEGILKQSVGQLCMMVHKVFGSKAVILIDEYDTPLNNSYGKDIHQRVIDFIKAVMISALKGNDDLQYGVVTGVVQISKETIFSGMNSICIDNVFTTESDDMFGFTSSEVERMCADFGHPEKFEEIKEWYNGYRFGNEEIYNPWSVMNYFRADFKPSLYWAGTSSNSILKDALAAATPDQQAELKTLAENGSFVKDLPTTVTYKDVKVSTKSLYPLMVMTGYLRAEPRNNGHMVSIPNKEMFTVFANIILESVNLDVNHLIVNLTDSILENDTEGIEKSLYDIMAESASVRMLENEHTYQALILGLILHLRGRYEVTADFESGRGYHDIRMRRLSGDGPNVVMEIKVSKGWFLRRSMESLASSGLRQIRSKDYIHGLSGRTLIYGIAFSGKDSAVVLEELMLRSELVDVNRVHAHRRGVGLQLRGLEGDGMPVFGGHGRHLLAELREVVPLDDLVHVDGATPPEMGQRQREEPVCDLRQIHDDAVGHRQGRDDDRGIAGDRLQHVTTVVLPVHQREALRIGIQIDRVNGGRLRGPADLDPEWRHAGEHVDDNLPLPDLGGYPVPLAGQPRIEVHDRWIRVHPGAELPVDRLRRPLASDELQVPDPQLTLDAGIQEDAAEAMVGAHHGGADVRPEGHQLVGELDHAHVAHDIEGRREEIC